MTQQSDQQSNTQIRSYAKINLFLHITGRKENGYHTLQSLMTRVDLYDLLVLTETQTPGITCSVRSPWSLPPITNNLITKAAWALAQAYDIKPKLAITLYKYTPVSAGLGGGSGNAATILTTLNKRWNLNLSTAELAAIGLTLGSDIPFMLHEGTALVEGIGEIISLTPDMPQIPILLINPNVPLLTSAIFQSFKKSNRPFTQPLSPTIKNTISSIEVLSEQTHNDLETAAYEALPPIRDIQTQLKKQKGCLSARMSGSGATCFGIFESFSEASNAASKIQQAHPEWWCYATHTRVAA